MDAAFTIVNGATLGNVALWGMDPLKTFGSALRRARERGGLSQEDLAHRAGVSVGYLSQLENGRRNPSLLLVLALCGALDTELTEMLSEVVVRR
jgi:transcriptional regulator with XRE-family HTH domain